MKRFESEHYIFHFEEATKAEQDINTIVEHQEACMRYMCAVLDLCLPLKIQCFLCDTPEKVGLLYNGEPCNGLAVYPDKIYAVYNEQVQCIGFHENAHLISLLSYDPNPDSPAIEEGFAMFFDRKWWGIDNLDWAGYYIKRGKFVPVDRLLDANHFYTVDCAISYPIMGAFTQWLISVGGLERYLRFFRKRDQPTAMMEVYGKTPEELNQTFSSYLRLFTTDRAVEQQMARLLDAEQ